MMNKLQVVVHLLSARRFLKLKLNVLFRNNYNVFCVVKEAVLLVLGNLS
jgi:hypothetical protein